MRQKISKKNFSALINGAVISALSAAIMLVAVGAYRLTSSPKITDNLPAIEAESIPLSDDSGLDTRVDIADPEEATDTPSSQEK